jgi:RNA polymerase sigma factor (sigma-70 family)
LVNNCQDERDRLFGIGMRLVAPIARRELRTHRGQQIEDLTQAGTIGLLEACRRFDSDREVPFAAYARPRIRGAILDFCMAARPVTWQPGAAIPQQVAMPPELSDAMAAVARIEAATDAHRIVFGIGLVALNDREFALVQACYVAGLDLKAAGKSLQMAGGAARKAHSRAMGKLRKKVKAA